jgi:HlyD family secretion protein
MKLPTMKKKIIIAIIIVIAALATWQLWMRSGSNGATQYAFVEIQRGDIQSLISSTGTLQAVETVDVGTQVSGNIDQILVDFNDVVRHGQLLARLDTSLLKVSVRDAEASVARAQAEYNDAKRDLERNQTLFDRNLLSEKDHHQSLTDVEMAHASVLSAKAALDRAKINLEHAEIHSPIDGIVIERSVDEGQTVAASLSAPTLFIIAKNLTNMQILAQADESDIGQIREGQSVRFTVPAYPYKTFQGQVQQIRLQPETVSNVVMYTVVVDAENKEGLLLPGMTATVDFVVQDVRDALCVSNAAVRFQPTDDMIDQVRKNRQVPMQNPPDSLHVQRSTPTTPGASMAAWNPGSPGTSDPPDDLAMLWFLDKNGRLATTPIRTGATNGTVTEILNGRHLHEGMKVISGIQLKNDKTTDQKSSGTPRGGPRGPRLF